MTFTMEYTHVYLVGAFVIPSSSVEMCQVFLWGPERCHDERHRLGINEDVIQLLQRNQENASRLAN